MSQSSPTVSPAIAALKALSRKAPAPTNEALSNQVTDPAIAGAKRDGKSSAVKLGFDPAVAEAARHAAELKDALDQASAEFAVSQARMREYGKAKRDLYNETFKSDVTTVAVPYSVEVPGDGDVTTPGRETRFVQVICTSKYSVSQDSVTKLKPTIGPAFSRLFTEETTKILNTNAVDLIRQVLQEAGLEGEELESSMGTLFETQVRISASKSYEAEIRKVPSEVRALLDQVVTRQQPGVKFGS